MLNANKGEPVALDGKGLRIGIVQARPKDESELLDVAGIGPAVLQKYGRALLSIVARPER